MFDEPDEYVVWCSSVKRENLWCSSVKRENLWCSSVKRENFNHIPQSNITRVSVHSRLTNIICQITD